MRATDTKSGIRARVIARSRQGCRLRLAGRVRADITYETGMVRVNDYPVPIQVGFTGLGFGARVVRFAIPARQGAIPARLEVYSPLGALRDLALYVDDELVYSEKGSVVLVGEPDEVARALPLPASSRVDPRDLPTPSGASPVRGPLPVVRDEEPAA